jgi:hypothetical protein
VRLQWVEAINGKSPQAIRMLKHTFKLADDGLVGQQLFAGEATRLAYMTDEAIEGREHSWPNATRTTGSSRVTFESLAGALLEADELLARGEISATTREMTCWRLN